MRNPARRPRKSNGATIPTLTAKISTRTRAIGWSPPAMPATIGKMTVIATVAPAIMRTRRCTESAMPAWTSKFSR